MITNISVKNFQSHSNSELEFVSGINVIVGASDSGKSAIIRALKWLLFNRPLGTSFIRKKCKGDCSVILKSNHGIISRNKTERKGGEYKVNNNIYSAVGSDVPKEVYEVLDVDESNFQYQLDKHYLVLGTGGEIASKLNEVLKIDTIDLSIDYCSSRIREIEKERRGVQQQLESKTNVLKTLEVLDEIKKLEEAYFVEKMETEVKERISVRLISISRRVESILSDINEIRSILLFKEDVMEIEGKIALLIACENKYNQLRSIYKRICPILDEIKKIRNILLFKDDIDEIEQLRCQLSIYDDKHKRLESISINEDVIVAQISNIEKIIEDHIKSEKQERIRYKEVLFEAGLCPVCGRQFDEDTCTKMEERL